MRATIAGAVALSLAATPALACVPFQLVSAVAHGKVRTARGDWAEFSMETDRSLVRIEYTSSASPTGRFAIVGNIDDGWAYGFPVDGPRSATRQTPPSPPKRTTMQRLIDQAGLPGWAFAQHAYGDDPVRTLNGMTCRLTVMKGETWPLRSEDGARVCVHDVQQRYAGGLTLFAVDAKGQRVLETAKIDLRPVPLTRFNPPQPKTTSLVVASRTPTTCSG